MTETASKTRDFLERTFWTAVAAFVAVLIASPAWTSAINDLAAGKPVDIDALRILVVSAIAAAVTAAVNAVFIWLRTALPFLPSPGHGLPGAETTPVA